MNDRYIPRERVGEIARYEIGALSRGKAAADARSGNSAAAPAAPSRDAIEAAERAGREAGFAAGLAEGRAAALRITRLGEALDAAVRRFEADAATDISELSLAIARKLLRGNVELRRAALVDVVREALTQLPDELRLPQLVVHPADVGLVRAQMGDLLERGAWTITEDHRIDPGGCRIEGAEGAVDATLATRWKRVAAALGSLQDWNDA